MSELIDWRDYEQTRTALGQHFGRCMGYFRADGAQALIEIQAGIRALNAAKLVLPAHRIKGDALHFGAVALGRLAAEIEYGARDCLEQRQQPLDLVAAVSRLRPLFVATLAEFERIEMQRPGRRTAA